VKKTRAKKIQDGRRRFVEGVEEEPEENPAEEDLHIQTG
jgi:hypothetical protein